MTAQDQPDRPGAVSFLRAFLGPEIRAWHGEQSLGLVFWGYGAAMSFGFGLLYVRSLYGQHILLQQALLPCFAGYTFWVVVCLWRSGSRIQNTLWGALSRQLAVVWALNAILVVSFLQVELIETYLHRTAPSEIQGSHTLQDNAAAPHGSVAIPSKVRQGLHYAFA